MSDILFKRDLVDNLDSNKADLPLSARQGKMLKRLIDSKDSGSGGTKGDPGPAGKDGVTPDISMTATVDTLTGTPAVKITKGGTAEAPSFTLAFSNLKGEKGDKGDPGEVQGLEVIENTEIDEICV